MTASVALVLTMIQHGPRRVLCDLIHHTARVTIPKPFSINTLSVFTIAFKVKVLSWNPDIGSGNHQVVLAKNTVDGFVKGGFMFFLHIRAATILQWTLSTKITRIHGSKYSQASLLGNGMILFGPMTERLTIYISMACNRFHFTRAGDILTSSADIMLGHDIKAGNFELADFIIDKGTAWSATQRAWFASKVAGDKKGFPVYWPPAEPPNDDPVTITAPWTKLYDVPSVPASTKALKINSPTSASPFAPVYTIPAGADIVDPEVTKYDVPDGTVGGSTTNPWYTAYSLSPANSTGSLEYNEDACGQYVRTTGSNIYNRKLTEIGVYLKQDSGSSPDGGTLYIGIMKANGTYIAFGAGISPASLPTDWTLYTRQNFTAQYAVQVGDCVGAIWVGGTEGIVNIQRNTSPYESNSLSCQGQYYDGDWHYNTSYHIAGLFRYGGETITGSNPFYKITSTAYVAAIYQLNSTIEGIISTHVKFRGRRVGTAPLAYVNCYVINTAGTAVATIGSPILFNDISTSVQDLDFINRGNIIPWTDGYRIILNIAPRTGINTTTNYLELCYNVGPANAGYLEGTALKAQAWNGAAYADVSPVSDWAGKVYTGGSSFVAWWALGDGHRTKIGICVNDATAVTSGKKFSKFDVLMKKFGNPAGPIILKIYQKVGVTYELRATFNTILAESLTTNAATYPFTFVLNGYQTANGDLISIEYSSGDATNYVMVNTNTNAAAGAAGDGTKTCLFDYYDGLYFIKTDLDLGGRVAYTGGVPDLVSRSKRAFVCNSEEAPIRAKRITSVRFL